MKWIKITALLTLACWLVQSLMFIVLFASSFTHIVVQLFVSAGASAPETSAFLSGAMKALAWPVHSLFPSAWSDATFVQAILLLGLNSLIWGIVLGTLFYFLNRTRSKPGSQRLS